MELVELYPHQIEAIKKMKNGCILCGGVGSGKSRTAIAYYILSQEAAILTEKGLEYTNLWLTKDLYIITTARKRDTLEWEEELVNFSLHTDPEYSSSSVCITVDSWNNIGHYIDKMDSVFIFDEQRVIGYGAWTKAFLKIAKQNEWFMLSATPGDCWMDYIPVFIANGFYKHKTEFEQEHVIWSRISKFPKVDRYLNVYRLMRLRDSILVQMNFERSTTQHHINVMCDYDFLLYRKVMKERWNIYEEKPIKNAAELCFILRKLVNSDLSRISKILDILKDHHRAIIFYNYNYELDILKNIDYGENVDVAEWNSHKHQDIPQSYNWVYLVQYNSCEGWNCIQTNCMIFYSQNYSYKNMIQAAGRIDRMNTPFQDLYFYHLVTTSKIDLAIKKALDNKKKFNESAFYRKI